jgi:hypothetical protein
MSVHHFRMRQVPLAHAHATAVNASAADKTLIFPASLPDAQHYREQAQAAGRRVLGASSLVFDPAAAAYEEWAHLPYVHEPDFVRLLGELIAARGVTAIYSPHEVVSGVLIDVLKDIAPNVRLIEPNHMLRAEEAYRRSLARADEAARQSWFFRSGGAPAPTAIERAGLVRLIDTIPGMTDGDKIDALIEVMRHALHGDIVEIGSWWGRSAALLLLLGRRYGVGPVLCVDPWRSENLDQHVPVLDRASARMDVDHALTIFQINLSPLAQGDLNYIRAPSAEASKRYGPGLQVATEVFGETSYAGEIALLHIDGNHAWEAVEADARLWTSHVKPGGWIVFDDYVWAFGDGPRRVGDAYLAANQSRIDLSFVIGTALFVRLAE